MAKGRLRSQWEQTSLVAAICASPYRDTDKHKTPYHPWEFNPFAAGSSPMAKPAKKLKLSVDILKGFCNTDRHRNGRIK